MSSNGDGIQYTATEAENVSQEGGDEFTATEPENVAQDDDSGAIVTPDDDDGGTDDFTPTEPENVPDEADDTPTATEPENVPRDDGGVVTTPDDDGGGGGDVPPATEPENVPRDTGDQQIQPAPTTEFAPEFQEGTQDVPEQFSDTATGVREDVASQLSQQFGGTIDPSQVEVRLGPEGEQLIGRPSGEAAREIARQQASESLGQQLRLDRAAETLSPGGQRFEAGDTPDPTPGVDFSLQRDVDGGIGVDFSTEFEREFVAAQDPDAEPSDVRITDEGAQFTEQFQREEAAEDIPGAGVEDIQLTPEGPEVTAQFQREQAAQEMPGFTASELVVDDGEVRPSDEALQQRLDQAERQRDFQEQFAPVATSPVQQEINLETGGFDLPGQETQAIGPGEPRTGVESVTAGLGTLGAEIGGRAEMVVDDPAGALFGAPGPVESELGSAAFRARDVSRAGADFVTEEVVNPGAELFGDLAANRPAAIAAGMETDPTAETIARGFGIGATEATIGLPAGAVETGAVAAEGLEFTGRQIEQQGVVEGAETSAVAGGAFAVGAATDVAEQAAERPALTGSMLAGGLVTGVGSARAIESVGLRARQSLTTRGDRVDFEDITTEEAARTGELPEFETSPDAPTGQAVREVRQRATDQPETLQSELGESILFRSEAERLPSDVEAGRGQFELPGLFASPDASPLRLDIGAESQGLSSLRPRLPRPFSAPQRLSAFESPDIEGMPESAQGARIISDPDTGDPMPDPTTGGARFLESEADTGTAFVRPTGSRTTELEAIFPPGSEFTRVGRPRPVDVSGGDAGTLDVFRRVETDDGPDAPDVPEGETVTGSEILSRERRSGRPAGTPVIPVAPTPTPQPSVPDDSTFRPAEPDPTPTPGNVTSGRPGTVPETPAGAPFDTPPSTGPGSDTVPTGTVDPVTAPDRVIPPRATETVATDTGGPFGGSVAQPRPGETDADTVPSGSRSPFSSQPTGPSSPFGGTPTEPTGTTPPSEPTTPPSGPPTTPPGTPTEPPTSPPRGPPSTPPGSPFGGGSQPPSGPPGVPASPPGGPPRTPRTPEGEPGDRDDEEDFVAPEGTPFFNPIATGGQLLFGDFGGDGGSENPDPTGLFLG